MIKLDFEAPPADLTAYISGYYLFRTDEPCFQDIDRADIAQCRFVLEGVGHFTHADGRQSVHYPAMLMGPSTVATPFELRGPAALFGVGLLPAGWVAFTGLSADKFVNHVMDATEILGPELTATTFHLPKLTSLAPMAALMNIIWRSKLVDLAAVPHWFIHALDSWLESSISPELAALEAATGLSQRQVERYAKTIYGSGPKLLARKYRALRTASAIAHGQGDWQSFIDGAYYDQSHCIREIKEFIGITPGAIRDNLSRLTTLTLSPPQSMARMPALSAMATPSNDTST